ncbi:AHH domain-containing protein [Microbulbifer sp. OS29]|uniref:AHH domain-containing protein n=1 Tax=Microbulbifer okhotskensis TaxID=2926617 RepID=A0A9X2ELB6_9GAMM|nr:AHH domain-containing protein [Microbulbifer okhotskensis]MCO1333140.1 AHH domain-containing protein [Microbulbifer okhotskensis]
MEHREVVEIQPHELLMGLAEVIRETQRNVSYYEVKKVAKTHLDQVIDETLKREKKALTEAEIVALASRLYTQIMCKTTTNGLAILSKYYSCAQRMSRQELMSEKHKPSRLGRHLKYVSGRRPLNVSAHAIVSGTHPAAKAARSILARWKIRIDDPGNGVFLPRDSRYIPHKELPLAKNHAQLHTHEYYLNVFNMLSSSNSEQECRLILRLIADQLRNGTFGD